MSEAIRERIQKYITTEILFTDGGEPLRNDKPLLGDVIDSMGIQMLVSFLEDEYDISIPDAELIAENFQDINSISHLVERLLDDKN